MFERLDVRSSIEHQYRTFKLFKQHSNLLHEKQNVQSNMQHGGTQAHEDVF